MDLDDGADPGRFAPLVVSWLVGAAIAVVGSSAVVVMGNAAALGASADEALAVGGWLLTGLAAGAIGTAILPPAVADRGWLTWLLAGLPGPTFIASLVAMRNAVLAIDPPAGHTTVQLLAYGVVAQLLTMVLAAAAGALVGGLTKSALT